MYLNTIYIDLSSIYRCLFCYTRSMNTKLRMISSLKSFYLKYIFFYKFKEMYIYLYLQMFTIFKDLYIFFDLNKVIKF